ncbi:mitoribosomal protein mS63 [Leishmania donovani]|uniref:Uncharacterized protein n=3 Tax=Leishmania donovani species complex TaxID=38574 RepID=A4HWM8_LEIIN|nr:conserved hypothetical protein [Leishmania infantum JPCM5]CAC9473379.1 hypothetical_protein_-_conserved [Leishmania infantum]CAJ1987567.1 mitoribosomal protein mS63 [Leishmania donovani]CAM66857.1 conserved hypothetical protein [Leishmania infantum JPCM5]SUZ40558.1 hypothetical_protein_-_conserved [Leishmania infantum]VDZ43456.1 hypothetical_protein_conserved [Leishmania donovani]|eukprot:XP_001464469.1 conserved hypothetical protein [Leishmania infantum JPCM5]
MLSTSQALLASLRYRRPYWMLFLKGADNWKIYTVIQQPDHQRTEMLYQAWLGGLDRPYVRPKCMAHQPVWLSKKRHLLQKARLEGPETSMEKYVLEWYKKFHSFQGTDRPTAEDLHTAFDLVERPLDLSYACQLLNQCRNHYYIRLSDDSFEIFLEACLRVDRRDCANYALEHADELGFWNVSDNCRRYLAGEQTWYKRSPVDLLYYPLEENAERNAAVTSGAVASAAAASDKVTGDDKVEGGPRTSATTSATVASAESEGEAEATDDEIARLQAELEALEREMGAEGVDGTDKG